MGIVVEAAEGRLHNAGWKGGKHSHRTYPQRSTYNIHPHQVPVVGRFLINYQYFVLLFDRVLIIIPCRIEAARSAGEYSSIYPFAFGLPATVPMKLKSNC